MAIPARDDEQYAGRYRATVNLPRTAFPMRADLPRREPEIARLWAEMDLYSAVKARTRDGAPFILHDGPPFSNGDIHLGHAVNKMLKDITIKFRTMQGYHAPFVPGWDAHGLPTEILAVRSFSVERHAIDPLTLRKRCTQTARKYVDRQRAAFQRLGIRADWDRPYLTLQPAYEAVVLETLAAIAEAGLIYRGMKPVYWCTTCETALAEAEIEYREHEAPSVYVAYPVRSLPDGLFPGIDRTRMSAAIWTTTPWTLPAGVAVAVHPSVTYVLATDAADAEGFTYLVAEHALPRFAQATAMREPTTLAEVSGAALAGAMCRHPLLPRDVPIVTAEYVTTDTGSGLVHVAPGHGGDDFLTGLSYGLPVVQPVGPDGIYGADAGPYAGKTIYAAQDEILTRMDADGTLLAFDTILHQYPHCWRCRHAVIQRATRQWFLAVAPLLDRAEAAAAAVAWVPAWGGARLRDLLRHRPDWCLSRQRAWGTPIPAVYCDACGEALLDPAVVRRAAAVVRTEGAEAWLRHPAAHFLPTGFACPHCGGTAFRKETDILDVWFDSGCSSLAVLDRWPADLYLEGHDQFRGWFQTSLLVALAAGRDTAPYRTVFAHGFVLDRTGQKQSKSLGNIIDPQEVARRYGADILRLWTATADTRGDIAMSEESLAPVTETYRRIRNTLRFLLANLYDFSSLQALPFDTLPAIDRWVLHRLNGVVRDVTAANEAYAFHRAVRALTTFCVHDLSAFYLDVAKDRLYLPAADAPERRAVQTVFHTLLLTLTRLVTPVLSFTAEEVWQHLSPDGLPESPQLAAWPVATPAWEDAALDADWTRLLAVRDVVQAAAAGKFPHLASVKATLFAAGETGRLLELFTDTLAGLLRVAVVAVAPRDEAPAGTVTGLGDELAVVLQAAPGTACPRCRVWRPRSGTGPHPDLCASCAAQVRGRGPAAVEDRRKRV
jgi:isoleucyl-tRNA synthetase